MIRRIMWAIALGISLLGGMGHLWADGDVQIEVNNGQLRVRGQNNTNQSIVVEPLLLPGRYRFRDPVSNTTTFNGSSSLTVSGVTGDMQFDLKSGKKIFILTDGISANAFPVPGNLKISSSGNENAIVILDAVTVDGRTDVKTKNGSDLVYFRLGTFVGRTKINTGNGADALVLVVPFHGGDLYLQSGGGDDVIYNNEATVFNRLDVRAGSGDDAVGIFDSVFMLATVNGNSGIDLISSSLYAETLIPRSFEIGGFFADVDLLLTSHPTFIEAEQIFTDLNLGNN